VEVKSRQQSCSPMPEKSIAVERIKDGSYCLRIEKGGMMSRPQQGACQRGPGEKLVRPKAEKGGIGGRGARDMILRRRK